MKSPSSTTIFHKMHGTGNDFVVVEVGDVPLDGFWVEAICDRHRGVGADGILFVDPSASDVDAYMTIFNRDGSRPEMCGNGVRCVARYLVETCGADPARVTIGTDAGVRPCRVDPDTTPWMVEVDMGTATVGKSVEVEVGDVTFEAVPVDVGNPHAVVFETPTLEDVDRLGAKLNDRHPLFPDGVNVEFTRRRTDNELDVVVYERGVGRTEACGTGACAAAIAHARRVDADLGVIRVQLPGGELEIVERNGRVWMKGDAEAVYEGSLAETWIGARNEDTGQGSS